jgi:hypothetical protein
MKFREMSNDELEGYKTWFMTAIPERVAELQGAIDSQEDQTDLILDYNPSSIRELGPWLFREVEIRPRTAEEIDRIKGRSVFDIGFSSEELTNRTFSLAVDVGMYFGETLARQHPNLEWHQPLGDRKFVDFGQMALLGFGRLVLNPVRITVTLCYGVASGKHKETRLEELYEYWSSLAMI